MLPTFPEFKSISFADKADIEEYTHLHAPYSDFNFFSFWCWDTERQRKVSILNDNLVVLMTDYGSNEPVLSFLGTNKTTETSETLMNYALENSITPTLRYVPEVAAKDIKHKNINVIEERGDFDYLYSVAELNILKGKKYKNKRQLLNWFTSDNPEVSFVQKKLTDSETKLEISNIINSWVNQKQAQKKDFDLEHEQEAIDKLLTATNPGEVLVSFLKIKERSVAFSIDEVLPQGYAISHFCKADSSYRGVYDYLNVQISDHLIKSGVKFWNWEQDLDIEGLREAKMRYRPVDFLKKYRVELKT